jgi:penicillin amidase
LGYVPPSQKPFLFNPSKGFIATANNQTVEPSFSYYVGMDYAPGYRAARIEDFLSKKEKLSTSDFQELQGDMMCLPAIGFMKSLQRLEVRGAKASRLLDILRSWDFSLAPESTGGAIYSVLFYRLLENTFRDDLEDLADIFFGAGSTPLLNLTRFTGHCRVILLDLMSDPGSPWFDDIRTSQREDLQAVLEKSLEETADFLMETLGTDPASWKWGKLHEMTMVHALGSAKPLDRILNLGPFPVGGDFTTVWQSSMKPGMDFRLSGWTASNRHIYDLEDWDRSTGAIVPGQSGMFGSPHYNDQVELWLHVNHHPLHYSRSRVESEAASKLLLTP